MHLCRKRKTNDCTELTHLRANTPISASMCDGQKAGRKLRVAPDKCRGWDGRDVREAGVALVVRLDRLVVNAVGYQASAIGNVDGFERTADFRPRRQGKLATFDRLRTFRSTSNSCQTSIQYAPLLPWLKPMRIKMVADDQTGLTPKEIRSLTSQCSYHQLSLVELALDF